MRGNGGIIGNPNVPTTSIASGVWGLREVTSAVRNSIWPAPAPGDIQLVGAVESQGSSETGTISLPTGLRQDDLVVFIGGHFGTGTSGFGDTEIPGYTTIDRAQVNLSRYVGYKVMGATPDTTLNIGAASGSGSTNYGIVIAAFRNVDTTTPFDVTSTTSTSANSADCPSITTISDKCMIFAGIVKDGFATDESTPPTKYTLVGSERAETATTAAVGCWYKSQKTAGTEDPGSGTGMLGDFQITMALRKKSS